MATTVTDIPVLLDHIGTSYADSLPSRSDTPTDVVLAQVKGMWAVVVESVVISRFHDQEAAEAYAHRVLAGAVSLPQTFPKSWGRIPKESR